MSFSPLNAAVLTGTVVAVGTISQDESVSMRFIVGGTVYAVTLGVINEVSPELASAMSLLVLIAALFNYWPAIADKLGLTEKSTTKKLPKPGGGFY